MKKRLLAFLLIAVLLVGLFAGCSKTQDPSDPGKPGESKKPSKQDKETVSALGKYAFKPRWIPLEIQGDHQPQYIGSYTISGNSMYFYAECLDKEEPMIDLITGEPIIDEFTGEPFMQSFFRSFVFRMDLETGVVTKLDSFVPFKAPEGHEGNAYITAIQAGKDDTIWVTERISTWFFDIPEDFDPEVDDQYAYYTQGLNKILMHQMSEEGAILQTVELNVPQDVYLNRMFVMDSGEIVGSDWQGIHIFDQNGQETGVITCEQGINNLFQLPDGSLAAWIWQEDGNFLKKIDLQAKAFGEATKLHYNAYDIYFGSSGFDYIYAYNGTFYGYKEGAPESEKLFSWIDCDVDSNNLNGETIFAEDGRVFTLEATYYDKEQKQEYSLLVMDPVDPSTLPVKQELVLACFYMPWDMRSEIVQFNRAHDDVRIVVKEYSQYATEEDPYAGLQKLNTEIMSGVIPDLFVMNAEMPVQKYEAQGIFMDLWPLIDSDAEFGREDLMTHFFDALSVDGKLYQITDSFGIATLVGKESVVGSGNTWTMDDFIATLDAQPEGTTIFGQYDTKESVLTNFIGRNAESFIDWKTMQCSFDSQEFINYLKFANQFPLEIDYEKIEYNYEPEAALLRSGRQMLYRTHLYSFESVMWANEVFGEKANFIGYPTMSNNGSSFQIDESMAISASCKNVDAAWSFIRTYLTEEHQTQEYMYEFPTNKHSFDVLVEKSKEIDYYEDYETGEQVPSPRMTIWYGDEEQVELYAVSDEEVAIFMEIYNNCSNFTSFDNEINKLILQEATAFFNGQKTAEEAARLIQDRVGLYVMENS